MTNVVPLIVTLVAVAYLPGAVLFRAPVLARETRASLGADERLFWQVVLSVAWSLAVTMVLAALSAYSFERLLTINAALTILLLLSFRGRLRLGGQAPKLTASALVPIVLIGLSIWRFFPASEYVIGGKDPGIYVNEGISIHRTGQLFRRDAIVPTVPEAARELFFRRHGGQEYYGLRFMGVFLNDPATGDVRPGFPHLFPASVALGYGAAGLHGATNTVAVWAVLGILAVFFFGSRLVGRLPAALACGLLMLNVVEIWFARYPGVELVMQALFFAALLAFARHLDGDAFFGWAAGVLCALLIFVRFDSYMVVAAMAGAGALVWIVHDKAPRWGFFVPIAAACVLAVPYYMDYMRAHFWIYRANLPTVTQGAVYAAAGLAVLLVLRTLRARVAPILQSSLPIALAVALVVLAAYALFFREPGGRLNDWNAYSLRTYRDVYVFWPALVLALAGYAIVGRKEFWRDPAFFLILAAFSIFFFYKIRVVAEQYWMARRFVPIIIPGTFLLAAAAAVGSSGSGQTRKLRRILVGVAVVAAIGWQYAVAAAPVAAHVEYRGAIRQVEKLAGQIADGDLLIVESRNAESDMHVFALPLAYAFGRHVLVLESPRPDRRMFEAFLADAVTRYERVLFVASAGTDLLTRRIIASPVTGAVVMLPEYETTPFNETPRAARRKDLSYNVYRLTLGDVPRQGFSLDVGSQDEMHVLRFLAREFTEGRTFRWTGPQSFVAVTGLTGAERQLTLVMSTGGRPAQAEEAAVEVLFGGVTLGRIRAAGGFATYTLTLPADVVTRAAASDDPTELRLRTTTWSPAETGVGPDTRRLGVMIDRVEIH